MPIDRMGAKLAWDVLVKEWNFLIETDTTNGVWEIYWFFGWLAYLVICACCGGGKELCRYSSQISLAYTRVSLQMH